MPQYSAVAKWRLPKDATDIYFQYLTFGQAYFSKKKKKYRTSYRKQMYKQANQMPQFSVVAR